MPLISGIADLGESRRSSSTRDLPEDRPSVRDTIRSRRGQYETYRPVQMLMVQRAAYDRYGSDGPARPGPGEFDGPDLDDIFAQMFGGGGGFGGASGSFDPFGPGPSRRPTRGKDTDVKYPISLEEAFKGKKVIMNLSRDRACGSCSGTGGRKGAKKEKCARCAGKGTMIQDRHVSWMRATHRVGPDADSSDRGWSVKSRSRVMSVRVRVSGSPKGRSE
jgi:DnaJ family protein A protein 2